MLLMVRVLQGFRYGKEQVRVIVVVRVVVLDDERYNMRSCTVQGIVF